MWPYQKYTREEFEKRKDFVEKTMLELGATVFDVQLPYQQKSTTVSDDFEETHISERNVFSFGEKYYRVDEFLSRPYPSIVVEAGSYNELMNDVMEDAGVFPFNLTDEEIIEEIRYSLDIDPYPLNDSSESEN